MDLAIGTRALLATSCVASTFDGEARKVFLLERPTDCADWDYEAVPTENTYFSLSATLDGHSARKTKAKKPTDSQSLAADWRWQLCVARLWLSPFPMGKQPLPVGPEPQTTCGQDR